VNVKAVLLDLDGTLLDNDVTIFIPRYFSLLSRRFSHLIEPSKFIDSLIKASNAMIFPPHPSLTNEQVFWKEFIELTGLDYEELAPQIRDFYLTDYSQLRDITMPMPGARDLLENLLERGYLLVVATSPIFPEIAIRKRLEWARIEDLPFRLVTTYENMHSGKPCLEYYYEILSYLGIQPWQAIMVGNSPSDDMVAKRLGLFTYLVAKDSLNQQKTELVDWYGPLEGLQNVLLPGH
jgi:FMN phosphatase YigB (HAD superfamily)